MTIETSSTFDEWFTLEKIKELIAEIGGNTESLIRGQAYYRAGWDEMELITQAGGDPENFYIDDVDREMVRARTTS